MIVLGIRCHSTTMPSLSIQGMCGVVGNTDESNSPRKLIKMCKFIGESSKERTNKLCDEVEDEF